MEKALFDKFIEAHREAIDAMRDAAHTLHANVNQTYDGDKPYSLHLDMVAASVFEFGHLVCVREEDVLPVVFGAYFHDSIEDARQSYNNVRDAALRWMDADQAHMAAEIVYALTNDKGRTRDERAGEHYYDGIRHTPYAPFVKLADRLANATYSLEHRHDGGVNARMTEVYRREMPHFLEALDAHSDDPRMLLPSEMVCSLK